MDEVRRNFTQRLNISSPVVYAEQIYGDIAEHAGKLIGTHRSMGAESRKNGLQPVHVELPCKSRQLSSMRMQSADIGRNCKYPLPGSQLSETFRKQIVELRRQQLRIDRSGGAVKAHSASSVSRMWDKVGIVENPLCVSFC